MKKRRHTKLVHEGQYVAEVEVELIDTDEGWSPYLSLEDAYKLDDVRAALRRGDIKTAARLSRVFTLTPVRVMSFAFHRSRGVPIRWVPSLFFRENNLTSLFRLNRDAPLAVRDIKTEKKIAEAMDKQLTTHSYPHNSSIILTLAIATEFINQVFRN